MRVILAVIALTMAAVAVDGFFHHGYGHNHWSVATPSPNENTTHPHHHRHHHHHHPHHHHHHHHHHECKGKKIHHNEEMKVAGFECWKEYKEAKENHVANRHKGKTCLSYCVGQKIGLFDKDGQIVQGKSKQIIEQMFESTEAQAEITYKVANCAQNNTEMMEGGPADYKCSNYKPYMKCVWLATMETCVKDFDPEDWE